MIKELGFVLCVCVWSISFRSNSSVIFMEDSPKCKFKKGDLKVVYFSLEYDCCFKIPLFNPLPKKNKGITVHATVPVGGWLVKDMPPPPKRLSKKGR